MADSTDLYTLASELLMASVFALDTVPADDPLLDGAPERFFVAPGRPALDCCPQLTVHVDNVTESPTAVGLESGRKSTSARISLVNFIVTSVRCLPKEQIPPIDEIDAVARQVDADGWALWNVLWSLWASGDLFSVCGEVFWDGLRALNPSGGCVGWTLSIRARLDGYLIVTSS